MVDSCQLLPPHAGGAPVFLLIEPEQNEVLHPRTRAYQSTESSAGGFVSIHGWNVSDPKYGVKIAGETAYPAEIATGGVYQVWVRARWRGACANSITLGARKKQASSQPSSAANAVRHLVGNDTARDHWHWVQGPDLRFDIGQYVLLIGTRESGASVDCILLTTDRNLVPHGIGKGQDDVQIAAAPVTSTDVVFSESFATVTDSPDFRSSRWLLDNSEWRGMHHPGLGMVVGPYTGRQALAQAVTLPFRDARIGCSVYLTPRVGAGVFFGRRSREDFFVVRIATEYASRPYARKIQLGHHQSGSFAVLAEADCDVLQLEWARIDVWTGGRFCRVHLGGIPVIDAVLPRSPEGHAGLYVDAKDRMFRPNETLVQIHPIPTGDFRMPPVLAASSDLPAKWKGLAIGYAPDECYVARWSNVSPDASYAKRVELVRERTSGESELVASRWGLFKKDEATQLELRRLGKGLFVSVNDRVLAPIDASDDMPNLVGQIEQDQPRALFGDFAIQSFKMSSPTSRNLRSSPVAGSRIDDESQHVAWTLPMGRTASSRSVAITLPLHGRDLPFAIALLDEPQNARDILWVDESEDSRIRLKITSRQNTNKPKTKTERIITANHDSVLQFVADSASLRVFVDNVFVMSSWRDTAKVDLLEYIAEPGSKPAGEHLVSRLPWRKNWIALGYGWRRDTVAGPVMHGNASVRILGALGSDARSWNLTMHGRGGEASSGFQLELQNRMPRVWRLFRDGKPIGGGRLHGTSDDSVNISLQVYGHVLLLSDSDRVESITWLRKPPREGLVDLATDADAAVQSAMSVQLSQLWDVRCHFHPEMSAASAVGLWRPLAGSWTLGGTPSGVSGFLRGSPGPDQRAAIEYRGHLDDTDVLVELRLERGLLRGPNRLSVDFSLGDGTNDVETAEFSRTPNGDLNCQLRSNDDSARALAPIDSSKLGLILTILRTGTKLVAELDHVPMTTLMRRSSRSVKGLILRVEGPTGNPTRIRSIAIQRDPLSPDRVPQALRTHLQFLHDALKSRTDGTAP